MPHAIRVLLIVLSLGAPLLCCGDQSADAAAAKKEATIRELLEVTGAGKLGTQVIEQMGAALGSQVGSDFSGFWAEFSKSVKVKDLEDMIVPIYAKHFEQGEIEELIRFNKTPVGQKLIAKMPEIMGESMAAGMKWGQQLGEEAMKRYEERKGK